MFMLYWDAATKKVHAVNGSGRAGNKCTLNAVCEGLDVPKNTRMHAEIPLTSAHAVTVPGAAAGWVDVVEVYGSGNLSMQRILAPAIDLGEKGFPVSEIVAHAVSRSNTLLCSKTYLGPLCPRTRNVSSESTPSQDERRVKTFRRT